MVIAFLQDAALVMTVAAGVSVLLELVVDAWTKRPRDMAQTRVNLWLGVPGQALAFTVVGALLLTGLSLLPAWSGPLAPTPLVAIACFVGVDFLYYWSHRLEHRLRALWGHHSVHHSSGAFDLSTAVRIAWHDGILACVYFAPLALLGFPPLLIVLCYELVLGFQTWVHTTRVPPLPFVEGILNTPSAHRVHHAVNGYAIDKNYGGVFVVWDRLFGTYAAERTTEAVVFGLTTPVTFTHPVAVNFAAYPALAREVVDAPRSEKLLALLGPPEWSVREGFARTRPSSWWASLARRRRWRGAPTGG